MEEQNVRPPDYEYYLSRGRIPAGRLNNPFLDRILLPSNPVDPLPWPLNRSARVVNQYTNGNVPPIIQPLPPPPPTVVNPSPFVRYPRGPLFFLVRLARDNLAARASVSANAPSISNNRPNGLVVAAVPNVGASPAVSQPDNAPDEPQGQLVPRANSLVAPTPLMQVRAQYRNRTFDISPAILPRLRAAGPPPHYLGSPSYQNGDWNLKFQIIISPAGTPLADGVFNFVDIFSNQDLLRVSTEYMYSIFNANRVDMRIPLRFDTRSRMLVVTKAPIRGPAVPQPVPGPNNNNGNIPCGSSTIGFLTF